ncbi:uncharacterized protein LOC132269016 [Cornus florida]|uniref:uncharacterized protein LOC132269016 n=1 Tax=Cornus florida TaxID=4283 RepID=UPI00289FA522|nr:uncharacterized protein LOC132269016 [Cornus florida]
MPSVSELIGFKISLWLFLLFGGIRGFAADRGKKLMTKASRLIGFRISLRLQVVVDVALPSQPLEVFRSLAELGVLWHKVGRRLVPKGSRLIGFKISLLLLLVNVVLASHPVEVNVIDTGAETVLQLCYCVWFHANSALYLYINNCKRSGCYNCHGRWCWLEVSNLVPNHRTDEAVNLEVTEEWDLQVVISALQVTEEWI